MRARTLRDDEFEQAWELDRDAFHQPPERRERFRSLFDPDRFVGVFEGDRLVAQAQMYGFGQFFGGRRVPMGGVASVAVAPDRRGGGLARRALACAIDTMRERGDAISTLNPAATGLYRSLGWEVAGAHHFRTVAPAALRGLPRPDVARVRPAGAADLDALRACYARVAPGVNGCLDRSERWWSRRTGGFLEGSLYAVDGEAGGLDGYLAYHQVDGEYSALGGDFQIVVDEVVATTRDAALALWGLLGSWSPQVDRAIFRGPAEDPLLLLLPDQHLRTLAEIRWMTRLVDAQAAVEARGFAPGLDVEVPIALRDPQVPAHDGAWVLHVHKGRGRLERGGPGSVQLDVGAFASLYTGWATTGVLARTGRIDGGSVEARALLDAAFAGPTPFCLDEF